MSIKRPLALTFSALVKQPTVIRSLCFITLAFLLLVETRFLFAQPPDFGQLWDKYPGNPLFNQIEGSESVWNKIVTNNSMNGGHVLWDGTEYKFYIGGFDGENFSIGLTTSSNLESDWTWYTSNPVLTPGPDLWDDHSVGSPVVVMDGDTYKMWYLGCADNNYNCNIGYATSTDGITWEKYAGNPVLEYIPGTWENSSLSSMYVIRDGDTLRMWYADEGLGVSGIGYAKSVDGITWDKSNENPVLRPGPIFSWDDVLVTVPSVILENGEYLMWYWGVGNSQFGPPWQTGFAKSNDGIDWTKDLSNPIFRVGNAGEWDMDWAVALDIFKIDSSIYKMLYIGSNLEDYYLGLATLRQSPVNGLVETNLSTLPNSFALHQNYPNPFNPRTIINYELPNTNTVEISVHNILGQKIATLVSEKMPAGQHQVEFNAQNLSSGIYYYKIDSGKFQDVKKMILIK